MRTYSIVPPLEQYIILPDIHIISGTPFLYIPSKRILVMGDIHLGHESALFHGKSTNSHLSQVKLLVESLNSIRETLQIDTTVINGDIKHHTQSIIPQEVQELNSLISYHEAQDIDLILVEGNHDPFLHFLVGEEHMKTEVVPFYEIGGILIHHGHNEPNFKNASFIIISHEHPAFQLRGYNRARVKLPAFVKMRAAGRDVVITPPANSISSGMDFPVGNRNQFLSPFLQKHAEMKYMSIYPYDKDLGIFELPRITMR